MNNYIVYIHISPSNKRYIGITSKKPNKRWQNGKGYKRQDYFYRAIEKYGWDNFQHIIIAKGLTKEEAEWLEIELIREWDTTNKDKGYNLTLGGEGGVPTEDVKQKISENRKGKCCGEDNPMFGKNPRDFMTEEEIKKWEKKMSEIMSGENHPMFGKHHTEETKQKIRENQNFTEESRKKISESKRGENNPMFGLKGELNPLFGTHRSEETKKKISEANLGREKSIEEREKLSKSLMGHEVSEETRKKIGEKQKGGDNHRARKILCLETMEIFECVTFAWESVNGCPAGFYKAMKNNKKYKGYTFMYYDKYLELLMK